MVHHDLSLDNMCWCHELSFVEGLLLKGAQSFQRALWHRLTPCFFLSMCVSESLCARRESSVNVRASVQWPMDLKSTSLTPRKAEIREEWAICLSPPYIHLLQTSGYMHTFIKQNHSCLTGHIQYTVSIYIVVYLCSNVVQFKHFKCQSHICSAMLDAWQHN